MKVVILAGGLGTRLAEETEVRPKPMVEVGGYPILWHIMKHYAHYGFTEFFIALGYKGDMIKRYFLDYYSVSSNLTVALRHGEVQVIDGRYEDWTVHLIDTGLATNTGGRVKRLLPWLGDEPFMVTYGDGVCNVDLGALVSFHRRHGRTATVTAVRPPARALRWFDLRWRHCLVVHREAAEWGGLDQRRLSGLRARHVSLSGR